MQHIRSDKAKNLGSSGLKFKEGNQGGFWGEEDITHYIHGSSGGDPKLEGSLTWQAGRPPSVTSGRVSVPLISSEAPLISDLPLSLCHFRGVKRCLETYRDQDRLPIGVGIRRLLLDTGIAGGAEKTEVDLLIHPTLIAGWMLNGQNKDIKQMRKSRSISPRGHRSRSPTPRRHRSRSPATKRYRRHRSRSSSLSPVHKSSSSSLGSIEQKNVVDKQRKEEEKKR
ncbi:hypothetical protein Ahy_A10g050697 isoform C [Arachis hypogaea]|nr:hypothetical protein Ahy_A10g050697 isoform C [Arachis hypogaea]